MKIRRLRARERLRVELLGELTVLLAERLKTRVEGLNALCEAPGAEAARLKGVVVASERALGLGHLLGERGPALGEACTVSVLPRAQLLDRLADQLAVAVELCQLGEHGGLERLAADALAVAGFAPELLAARAGVVAVGAAVALCAHADVGAPAAPTADEPGEQVVRRVGAARREVLAALFEKRPRAGERLLVDERLVQALKGLIAPVHAPYVGLILEDVKHHRRLPTARRAGRVLVGEASRDRRAAEPSLAIEVKDAPHGR